MATASSFNKNNSAIKRIMREARELADDPSTDYTAAPLDDNLFEWHCTIRGAPDTEFEGGLYHFRIILPGEYPFRPPSLVMLTPSGRFETNTKICISFTNYHEEMWQPAWGVRTAIVGLQGFFPLKGQAAMGVGSMEAPTSERRRLAKLSRSWVCPKCNVPNEAHLPDVPKSIRQEDHLAMTLSSSYTNAAYERADWTNGVAKSATELEAETGLKSGFQRTRGQFSASNTVAQGLVGAERACTARGGPAMSTRTPIRGAEVKQQFSSSAESIAGPGIETLVSEDGEVGSQASAYRSVSSKVTGERTPENRMRMATGTENASSARDTARGRTATGVPVVLDGLICMLIVFVGALLYRKLL